MIDWLANKYALFVWYVFIWAGSKIFDTVVVDKNDDKINWIFWKYKDFEQEVLIE